jgi:hypothetical protein
VLLISNIAGYRYTVSLLNSAGLILENDLAWSISGALVFTVVVLPVLALLAGPLLMLIDIRNSLAAIETRRDDRRSELPPPECREPLPSLWEDPEPNALSDAPRAAHR